jgi:LysM repeat protein
MGMIKLITGILILIFSLFSISTFSQEKGQEIKEGKVYKVHLVEAGNTLYGLHKKYNISIEAILKANPEAANGLDIGQKLLIPSGVVAASTQKHIVESKQTLYGISRIYNCTVEELIKLNPTAEKGLDIGQVLIVPATSESQEAEVQPQQISSPFNETVRNEDTLQFEVSLEDSVLQYTVKEGETLYSIARRFMVPLDKLKERNNIRWNRIKPGQVLIIPLKKESVEKIEVKPVEVPDMLVRDSVEIVFQRKEKYKIAVLLPLRIEENGKILSGIYNEHSSLDKLTDISLDFFMGAQMALDSLEQLGLNADVEFFDTRGDIERMNVFLNSENALDLDLIIGPFYPNLLEVTAKWCKIREVRMLAVTKVSAKILENNPFVYSLVPSEMTLIAGMAKYLALEHADDDLFLINGRTEETRNRNKFFLSVYNQHLPLNGHQIKSIGLGASSGRDLFNKIDEDTTTLFICLESDVKSIMNMVNTLNAAKNYSSRLANAKVYLVGTSEWLEYSAFNTYYKNRFHFHFASSNYLNYQTDSLNTFVKKFRERYEADPSQYAIHAFDAVLSQGAEMMLGLEKKSGLMDYFSLEQVSWGHGYENMSAFIAKQMDYEIHLLDIVDQVDFFIKTPTNDVKKDEGQQTGTGNEQIETTPAENH